MLRHALRYTAKPIFSLFNLQAHDHTNTALGESAARQPSVAELSTVNLFGDPAQIELLDGWTSDEAPRRIVTIVIEYL